MYHLAKRNLPNLSANLINTAQNKSRVEFKVELLVELKLNILCEKLLNLENK